MEIRAEKAALRAALRQTLNTLDAAGLAASDAGIMRRLEALPLLAAAATVFCYVSVGAEPDTRALITALLAQGKTVCVPRCEKGGQMQAVPITGLRQLAPGFYGLPEPPAESPALPPSALDVVIAPCVAADREGRRLGNGGGYYDRYLAGVSCPVVCLCRAALLQNRLPAEPFDRPVTLVLTEDGAWPAGTAPG